MKSSSNPIRSKRATARRGVLLAAFIVLAVLFLPISIFSGIATAAPIDYVLTGSFDTVNFPEGSQGPGPFDNRPFTIDWTVPNPTLPDDPFGTRYFVDATLSITGIGTFQQSVTWSLSPFGISYGLGGFNNVLVNGDSLFFGICGGGSCNDPILYNQDPFNPVLFTGTFPLGLDASCTVSAPCLNAQTNYFGTEFIGTRYFGTLTVTEGATPIPEPTTLVLMILGLAGLGYTRRRIRTRSVRWLRKLPSQVDSRVVVG
jgi:PEP-CTERM motif-containing protein